MSHAEATLDAVPRESAGESVFAGHPKGLGPLFFTELWERFSYYGMRAILILYMTSTAAQGGLGFDVKHASSIYGTYTMAVYLTALPGGLFAGTVAKNVNTFPEPLKDWVGDPPIKERSAVTLIPVLVGFCPGATRTVRVVDSP